MEGVSLSVTNSDEYLLLESYWKRRKPKIRMSELRGRSPRSMCSLVAQSDRTRAADKHFSNYDNVAEKLTQIADSELRDDTQLESDSVSTDIIEQLVELLKKSGDDLNEKIEKNHELLGYLQSTFSYDLFEKLTTGFIRSVVPECLMSRKKSEQIALTFEVTSRLGALDLHPMNKVMGFGAQYLQNNFTPWVKQHGGWEKAFGDNDQDELH